MDKIRLDQKTRNQLIELNNTTHVMLEGSILKLIETGDDPEFDEYLKAATEKDKETRRKRLDVTKQVQSQYNDLIKWKKENERVNEELKEAMQEMEESKQEAIKAKLEAERAKDTALNDLEVMQKKSQFEMIGDIVKAAIGIIFGVGGIVTIVFLISIIAKLKTDVIGSAWVNIMSILLTNAFSIIGTLMGVKTMSDNKNSS